MCKGARRCAARQSITLCYSRLKRKTAAAACVNPPTPTTYHSRGATNVEGLHDCGSLGSVHVACHNVLNHGRACVRPTPLRPPRATPPPARQHPRKVILMMVTGTSQQQPTTSFRNKGTLGNFCYSTTTAARIARGL